MNHASLLTFAHRLADAAAEVITPLFGTHGEVETKFDKTPVTEADKKAEEAMRTLIRAEFPDHAIFGEEMGREVGTGDWGLGTGKKNTSPQPLAPSPYTWLLDPIDGTRAFIEGRKEWGTLIALCENDVPILGILNQPVTEERWVGVKGQASTHNGEKIQSRNCAIGHAELSTTSASYFTPIQAKQIIELAKKVRRTVKDGDCYAYGLLARGMRDLVADAGLKPYDILALVPILEGAGGVISAWDGVPITLTHYATALAAGNAKLHQEALAFLHNIP